MAGEKAEDPFFKSMRVLRDLLMKPDVAAIASPRAQNEETGERPTVRAAQQRRLSGSPSQQRGTTIVGAPARSPQRNDDESKLKELQEKLREVDTTARKERALRKSIERAFEDLTSHRKVLTEELEKASSKCKPLQDEIDLLRKEKQQEHLASEEKTKKHLEEMDAILQQKQSALSQRDSMEAKMLGSEKLVEELQAELATLRQSLKKQETHHRETDESLKQCYDSVNTELEKSKEKILTLTNETAETRRELEETQALLREVTEQYGESKKEMGNEREEDFQTEKEFEHLKQEVICLQNQLMASKEESKTSQKILDEVKTKLATDGEKGTKKETERVQEQLFQTKAMLEQNKKLVKLLQDKVKRLEESDALSKKQLHDREIENQEQKNLLTATLDEAERLKEQLATTTAQLLLARDHNKESEGSASSSQDNDDSTSDKKRGRSDDDDDAVETEEDEDDDEVQVIEAEVVDEPSAKKFKGGETTDDEDEVAM